ncbi:hypothetical protein T12_13779 [Trichinella patagoniensis]|uniref:Uncharacterized protein n=1 Tax=Trichinella patagoniensis TaxID=990121 RepID=A0A0V0Z5N3_9BILA|nr:hypothetical protein T12_13779 [Trichinella patagoniensis]
MVRMNRAPDGATIGIQYLERRSKFIILFALAQRVLACLSKISRLSFFGSSVISNIAGRT